MKNEKSTATVSSFVEKRGLYDTPFQATTWAVEIVQTAVNRFMWIAKHYNTELSAYVSLDNKPFTTAQEAEDDFSNLVKHQCICVCSKQLITLSGSM
jgi:hypothetical protein